MAGLLAMSRSLGDFPLKTKNFITAEPDIKIFDLRILKARFIILASDGLWDVFSNEEAAAYVSSRLAEKHHGAKSLVIEAYKRGSVDNITVMVVVLAS